MEDNGQFKYVSHSPSAVKSGYRKAKPFVDVADFLKRVGRHTTRVRRDEERSLRHLSARRASAQAARGRTLKAWLQARTHLATAVRDIDTAVRPLGLGLSMADDLIHEEIAGAAEVRLTRLDGGFPRTTLDIEVDIDGHHRTHITETGYPVQLHLPHVAEVTPEQYRTALMMFVHDVMRMTEPRTAQPCPRCSRPTLTLHRVGHCTFDDEE